MTACSLSFEVVTWCGSYWYTPYVRQPFCRVNYARFDGMDPSIFTEPC